ncbi:DUF927 domain-containing protein, partial [Burkholderia gladioli]|nr:DUF927 domain-containing protein [Burkholderia gladioli]
HWVSTRIDVIAETRNEMNSEWGYLLEFTDRDGILKRWAVPAGLFAGDGTELRRMLLDMGVKLGVTQIARTQIANYVQMAQPGERVRCVPRVGWHHGAFVLPAIAKRANLTVVADTQATIAALIEQVNAARAARGRAEQHGNRHLEGVAA